MFTGLVEDIGTIKAVQPLKGGRKLTIRTRLPLEEIALGDSIAVNGVCLTADDFGDGCFVATVGRETVMTSTLGEIKQGSSVHLERALAVGDRLGGHLVQGHVDGVGRVTKSYDAGESWILWVELTPEIERYVVSKGSLTIDGVSLTVNEIVGRTARVNLVPHTAKKTRLGGLLPGAVVNLEVDIIAKYVERMMQGQQGLTMDKLRSYGY